MRLFVAQSHFVWTIQEVDTIGFMIPVLRSKHFILLMVVVAVAVVANGLYNRFVRWLLFYLKWVELC